MIMRCLVDFLTSTVKNPCKVNAALKESTYFFGDIAPLTKVIELAFQWPEFPVRDFDHFDCVIGHFLCSKSLIINNQGNYVISVTWLLWQRGQPVVHFRRAWIKISLFHDEQAQFHCTWLTREFTKSASNKPIENYSEIMMFIKRRPSLTSSWDKSQAGNSIWEVNLPMYAVVSTNQNLTSSRVIQIY